MRTPQRATAPADATDTRAAASATAATPTAADLPGEDRLPARRGGRSPSREPSPKRPGGGVDATAVAQVTAEAVANTAFHAHAASAAREQAEVIRADIEHRLQAQMQTVALGGAYGRFDGEAGHADLLA